MSRSYTSSRPKASMACSGTALLYSTLLYIIIYVASQLLSNNLCNILQLKELYNENLRDFYSLIIIGV
jgi:hypothetical protein